MSKVAYIIVSKEDLAERLLIPFATILDIEQTSDYDYKVVFTSLSMHPDTDLSRLDYMEEAIKDEIAETDIDLEKIRRIIIKGVDYYCGDDNPSRQKAYAEIIKLLTKWLEQELPEQELED